MAKVRRLWATGQKLYVIRNVDYELPIQNPDGELLRIVRWHGRDLTATRESNRHYIEERVASVPSQK